MHRLKFNSEKPYLFISYSSKNSEIVINNVEYLQKKYNINLWYDEDLTAGTNWDDEALPRLRDPNCKLVLFFASEEALLSKNVKKELDAAKRFRKIIIPINFSKKSFDDVLIEDIVRKYNRTDKDGVTNADELIKEHLNENKTFIYLHETNYYSALIKAITRQSNNLIEIDETDYVPDDMKKAKIDRDVVNSASFEEENSKEENNKKEDKKEEDNNKEENNKENLATKTDIDWLRWKDKLPCVKEYSFEIEFNNKMMIAKGWKESWRILLEMIGEEDKYKRNFILLREDIINKEEKHTLKTFFAGQKSANKRYTVPYLIKSIGVIVETYWNAENMCKEIIKLLTYLKIDTNLVHIKGILENNTIATSEACSEEDKRLEKTKLKDNKNREIGSVNFVLFGQEYKGYVYSDLLAMVVEQSFLRYPDKIIPVLDSMGNLITKEKPDRVSLYRAVKVINVNGENYYIGTSSGTPLKLKQIIRLFSIMGVSVGKENITIDHKSIEELL